MKYWQTPEFKALQKAWYGRLEAEGFEDIEAISSKGNVCLREHAKGTYVKTANDLRYDYFENITELITVWDFDRDVDRVIMLKHAQGLSERVIAKEIRSEGYPPCRNRKPCRNTVSSIIQRYREAWGLPRVVMRLRQRTG